MGQIICPVIVPSQNVCAGDLNVEISLDKNKHCNRCFKCGCLFVLVFVNVITASLSQRHCALFFAHWWSLSAPANTISAAPTSYCGFSLFCPLQSPWPQCPEALDVTVITSCALSFVRFTLFHSTAKILHHWRSARTSWLKHTCTW